MLGGRRRVCPPFPRWLAGRRQGPLELQGTIGAMNIVILDHNIPQRKLLNFLRIYAVIYARF